MKKLLVVLVLLAVASCAFAGWGVPMIAWFDPGDGPGPPVPHDPGDGPVLAPSDPAPEPYSDLSMQQYGALVSAFLLTLDNW